MRIARLVLTNWLIYRGTHTLELEAKPYAVVARHEDDAERSNALGKSSVLEAIDFALWGRHRHRLEDAFITRDEAIAEVILETDDGARIVRRRERGKRTTLHFHSSGADGAAMQDEAQRLVEQAVGLGPDDFLATCYFQQRQMARLILADPGTRQELVSGWLRLAPLERCEDRVGREVSVLAEQTRQMEAQLTSLDELEKHALDGTTREHMAELLDGHAAVLEKRRGQHAAIQEQIASNARLISAQGRVQDFEQLVADGKKLRVEVAQVDGEKLRAEHEGRRETEQEAGQKARMARSQVEEKRSLAQGQFDGVCPVAGIECPVKDRINKDRKRGLKLYEEARAELSEAEAAYEHARREEGTTRAALGEQERKESKLQAMREQAARMEGDYELAKGTGEPIDPQVLKLRLDDVGRRLDEVMTTEKTMRARLEQLEGIDKRRATIRASLGELRARLAVYREAAVVFGKQGAQRRVAEGALAEIEEGANDMLRTAEVPLSLGVKWSREGGGLARACDACGAPFPTSAKVKVCARCKAARGPNLINKLEVELSDRSGAMEDLGGAALQLSASAWLRSERGSAWGVALLDEPLGQLDQAHRRAFGRHLVTLLGGRYGFSQAFVVAHSPDVLAAMPGRIEIVGGRDGSTVHVVA